MSQDQHSAAPAVDPSRSFWWRHRMVVMLVALAVWLPTDQLTKLAARDALAQPAVAGLRSGALADWAYWPSREIVLIQGIFHLQYAENRAAAFSLSKSIPFAWRRPLLISVTFVALALLVGWLWRLREPDVILIFALALVVAGASGNLVDRIWHAYVIDFVSWRLERFFPSLPPWPTFNVADSGIVVGAIGLIFRSFFPWGRALKAKAEPVTG